VIPQPPLILHSVLAVVGKDDHQRICGERGHELPDVRVHFAHFGGDLRASRAVGVRQVVNAVPVHKEQGRHPPADDGERVRQHLIIADPVPILIGR